MEEIPQIGSPKKMLSSQDNSRLNNSSNDPVDEALKDSIETCSSNNFLRRSFYYYLIMTITGETINTMQLHILDCNFHFVSVLWLFRFSTEDRAVVSHLFHQWAKKRAFQDPKRLLNKVKFHSAFLLYYQLL